MKLEKIQPGYRVTTDVHDLVKSYAKELTDRLGFPVSANKSVELLIKRGYKAEQEVDQRG